MSVWSREDDGKDRMDLVVAEAKADALERYDMLTANVTDATKLLRDHGAHMTQDEIDELCDMLDAAHDNRGQR